MPLFAVESCGFLSAHGRGRCLLRAAMMTIIQLPARTQTALLLTKAAHLELRAHPPGPPGCWVSALREDARRAAAAACAPADASPGACEAGARGSRLQGLGCSECLHHLVPAHLGISR